MQLRVSEGVDWPRWHVLRFVARLCLGSHNLSGAALDHNTLFSDAQRVEVFKWNAEPALVKAALVAISEHLRITFKSTVVVCIFVRHAVEHAMSDVLFELLVVHAPTD